MPPGNEAATARGKDLGCMSGDISQRRLRGALKALRKLRQNEPYISIFRSPPHTNYSFVAQ